MSVLSDLLSEIETVERKERAMASVLTEALILKIELQNVPGAYNASTKLGAAVLEFSLALDKFAGID